MNNTEIDIVITGYNQSMIQLQSPFLLTNIDQIPSDLVESGINLEGNIFDGASLKINNTWEVINRNLELIRE